MHTVAKNFENCLKDILDVGNTLSCIGNYTSIPGVGCWRHYTYDVQSYIPGAGCWLCFIYTRCLMLAILYLYQVKTVHPYRMMEVSYTIPPYQVLDLATLPRYMVYDDGYTTCTSIPGVGRWLHYLYTRC